MASSKISFGHKHVTGRVVRGWRRAAGGWGFRCFMAIYGGSSSSNNYCTIGLKSSSDGFFESTMMWRYGVVQVCC
jgi:hypothetical protein